MEYYKTEEDGDLSYAVAKRKAFLYEYTWDGNEDSMTVKVPKKYDGKDVVAIGGFYGRGYPMPFKIDAASYYKEDLDAGAKSLDEYEVDKVDRKVQLNFLVLYRSDLKEGIEASPGYSEYLKLNGKVTEYEFNIDIRPKKDAKGGITPGITITEYTDELNESDAFDDSESLDDFDDDSDESSEEVTLFKGADESDLNVYNHNDNTLIILNPDGSLYQKIDFRELVPELFGDWRGISYACTYGHSIFFASYRADDQSVFEYNIDKKELNRIYRGIINYPFISIHDKELIMDDSEYNSTASRNEFTSYRIFRDANGNFNNECIYEDANKACAETHSDFSRRSSGNGAVFASGYSLSRWGKVAISKDYELQVYDENGNLLDSFLRNDENKFLIRGIDSEHIVYALQDTNYKQHGLYVYDLNTHEEKSLYTETEGESVEVLDYVDSVVYVGIHTEPRYNKRICDIKAISVESGEIEDVGRVESVPGHFHFNQPVDYAFKVMGNTVVYAGETDNATVLFCSVKENGKWVQKDLKITYKEYSYTKYATILSQDYSMLCPYCNRFYACRYYYEYPEVKSNVQNADKINRILRDEAEESYNSASDYVVYYSEEDCREYYHTEYDNSSIYFSRITGMDTVFDHYLAIYREGYDMEIGAIHGMDYSNCELFDLESGEKVKFKDIYKGSEEEFKEIVANAAREQFLNDPDFAESVLAGDDTEIYRDVLGYLSLDWDSFTFYDNYLTVDFDPYMLGAYSDGIIGVKVDYDKFGL